MKSLKIGQFVKFDKSVVKEEHIENAKELAKDLSIFVAGIFVGPIIDAGLLIQKHYNRFRKVGK